jgi:hypothetical protein
MEDDGIFYGHLVHFRVFCYILWTFGIIRGNLVYFFPFWYFVPRKIWQPCVPPTLGTIEKKPKLMTKKLLMGFLVSATNSMARFSNKNYFSLT